MSLRGPLTAAVTAVLGAALGGLLVWRVYRTKRKKLLPVQEEPPAPEETDLPADEPRDVRPADPLEKQPTSLECQSARDPPAGAIPPLDELLGVKPVMVSSEEEWQQLWPLLQKDLSVLPVLGLDCEWVKTDGVRNTFACF